MRIIYFLLSACIGAGAWADIVQFGIGRKTPVQDGVVNAHEYGAFVPYMYEITGFLTPEKLPYSERSPKSYFAWDDTCLYMAMVSDGRRLKTTVTEHDGPVYNDDSIDFYISGNGWKTPLHHFIFNAIGTIYDARDDKKAWDAKGVRVCSNVTNGLWIIEVAVPWQDVNLDPAHELYAPHVNLCRTYRSGQGSSVKFIDLDENYSVGLSHGPYAKRETQALVTLKEKVSEVEFPELKPPRPGENARTQVVSLWEKTPPGAKREIIFWGSYPLLSRDPVTFRSVTTDIPTKTLLFMTENNFPAKDDYVIDLTFRDLETDSKEVFKAQGAAAKVRGLTEQRFDVRALPEGEYKLYYRITGPNGSVVASDFTYYGRYPEKPIWMGCTAGAQDEVPPPWPKPTFRKDGFSCWGRELKFGGAGLITSIISQGREILERPISVVQDGENVTFCVTSFEGHVSYADYVLTGEGRRQNIVVRIRAEFDGYLWLELVRAAGVYHSLSVEIPLKRAYVTGFDDSSSVIEKLPLPLGKNHKVMYSPREKPFFWIGDGSTGLMGGTEDWRGWHLKNERQGYALNVNDTIAQFSFNIIDSETSASQADTVGFYLNPTPVRPKNIALEQFDASKMCRWTGNIAKFCDMKKPGALLEDKITRFIKRQANGEKVFWYGGSAIASPYSPLWAWFGKEWNFTGDPATVYLEMDPSNRAIRDEGGWIWGCLRESGFFDYRMWSSDWFLNAPKYCVSNLYFDISFPHRCRNTAHGCNNEYFFRGMREFHKRIYRQLKRKNPAGAMLGHVRFIRSPADNFFDESWCGEAYEIEVAKQHNYYNLLTPEAMQIHYASRAADMVMGISCQIYRTYQVYAPKELPFYKPNAPESKRAIRHAAAYFKIHNLLITVRPDESCVIGDAWWQAESYAHFLGADRKFSAYYLPDSPIKVDKPNRLFLYAISWNEKGEAALVILNDTDEVVEKHIVIDAAKIGLTATQGVDVGGLGKCTLQDGGFTLKLGPREARFFQFRK